MTRNRTIALVSFLLLVAGLLISSLYQGSTRERAPGPGVAAAGPEAPGDELPSSRARGNERVSVETHHPRSSLSELEAADQDPEAVVLVRVVDEEGDLIVEPVMEVLLETTGFLGLGQDRRRVSTEGGQASFANLSEGKTVEVSLNMAGNDWKADNVEGVVASRDAGPLVLELEVRWSQDIFEGRLVTPDGRVLGDTEARVTLQASHPEWERSHHLSIVRTRADGVFRKYIDLRFAGSPRIDETDRHRMQFFVEPEGAPSLFGESPDLPEQLSSARHDLGDIVMRAAPVIARGIVVDTDGVPLANAGITMEVRDDNQAWNVAQFGPRTTSLSSAQPCTSGEDGRFTVIGSLPGQDVAAVATLAGYYAEATELHQPGSRQLEIVMVRAGGIEGSLSARSRQDHGDQRPRWLASLSRAGELEDWMSLPRHGTGDRWDPLGRGDIAYANLSDGTFRWSDLPSGLYTVALRRGLRDMAVIVVEDIRVIAGEISRPEALQDLDPSALEQSVTLQVLDEQGEAVSFGQVFSGGLGNARGVQAFVAGKAQLQVVELPIQVEVRADGLLDSGPVEVTSDRTIVLRPGLPIRLSLPAGVVARPGQHFEVSLSRTGEPQHSSSLDPRGEQRIEPGGVLETRVGAPGPWSAQLMLSGRSADSNAFGSFYITSSTVLDVARTSEEQDFVLDLDQVQVDAAAEELRALLGDH